MQNTDEQYKKNFSKKLNSLYEKGKWNNAKKLLKKELLKFPNEYFLITSLAQVSYNLAQFEESLNYSQRALTIEPNDVLVNYDYGCTLAALDKNKEAIEQWELILEKGIDEIAYGKFGEGLKWAKSILNNTRYRKAMCLVEIRNVEDANRLIEEHLANRQRGIYSDFTKKQVLEKQKTLKNISA